MDIGLYFSGLVLGFSIAAPVGPIGVLCIRRTLADGRAVGFFSGLGAATADAVYGSIAAFGLTFLSSLLVDQQTWLRLIGGSFLLYLGVRTFLARPADRPAIVNGEPLTPNERKGQALMGAYTSTFFLTLTNPMTILSFSAMFASFNLGTGRGFLPAVALVLGVLSGSALWWLLLSGGVGLFRSRFTPAVMVWVNRVSGLIVAGFGVVTLGSLILKLV
jgi:threonine/homoserine/homoserine lactone efflux protein